MRKYRAVCPSCGEAQDVFGDAYCRECKTPFYLPREGMLQLYRMGNFYGAAAALGIYIDGKPYGHIGNRQTVCIPLPYGQHLIHVTCGVSRKCNDPVFVITPENPISYMKVYIRPGVFVNTQVVEPALPSEMPPIE